MYWTEKPTSCSWSSGIHRCPWTILNHPKPPCCTSDWMPGCQLVRLLEGSPGMELALAGVVCLCLAAMCSQKISNEPNDQMTSCDLFHTFFNRKCSCALMDDWMMTWYSTLCNSTYLSRSSIFIVNIFQYFEFDIIWHKPISLLRLIPTTMSPQRWPLDRNAETYVLTFILT